MEERYHATTQNRFYPDMSNVHKNITVEAKLINPPTYICYCRRPKIGKISVLPVNPSTYNSEVAKVRKMLGKASISGSYQTMSVNAGICRHLLVKVRLVWLSLCFISVCVF